MARELGASGWAAAELLTALRLGLAEGLAARNSPIPDAGGAPMADSTRRVSVRLSLDDAARVKAGLREVGETGQRSLERRGRL
jgi:hypothetical protein